MPFIQLPGDSTGKLLETVTPALSSAGSTMHREVLTLGAHGTTDIATVTATGGLLTAVSNPSTSVTITNPSTAVSLTSAIALSSGIVTLSSVPTVTATGPTTITSGLVSITSGTVTLSSTPFFNLVGSSSGVATVTTSGGLEVTIVSGAGAGSSQVQVVGTSGGAATVTTSGGMEVTIVSGAGAGSSEVHIVGTGNEIAPVTTSDGLRVNVTSGIVALSSGTVTLSSVHTVTATAATNPWSSAPGFNVPGVSASSGNVGVFPSTDALYDVFTFNSSSSNSITVVTTAPAILYGWNIGNQTTSGAVSVKVYNTSGATVGSTSGLKATIPVPGGSAGAGNNLMLPKGVSCTGGITLLITANFAATSTGSVAANDVVGDLFYNI